MGNTPLSSSDEDFTYGRTTEQIDGILTLKKQSTRKNTKQQWRWGRSLLKIPTKSSRRKNKKVKSILMRFILKRDWQKVLIRARLFPREIHEFTVLEVPLSTCCERFNGRNSSTKTANKNGKIHGVSYFRVKVLPVHAACALRPPPEVVRALLSHVVGSAFSSDGMRKKSSKKVFEKEKSTKYHHRQLSSLVPLHHEHNASFAAVGVERLEDLSIGKAIMEKLCLLGDFARKTSFCDKNVGKLRLLCSTTEEQDCESNDESIFDENGLGECEFTGQRSDTRDDSENTKDVALFLKRMEDHLAHNGRCRSVFRDANPRLESSNPRHRRKSSKSVFVMDFDPSVLLPSPSAVRGTEKRTRSPIFTKRDDDLFSLENSVGDSNTAMTTSTNKLMGNETCGDRKDSEESSSLEYLSDDHSSNSSASSSLLEPPSSDSYDSDDNSNDSNSFLQLTADGKLTVVDMEVESSSSISRNMSDDDCHVDEPMVLTSSSQSSGSNISGTNCSDSPPSGRSSSDLNFPSSRSTFVPEDMRMDSSALLQSLPPGLHRKRRQGRNIGESERFRLARAVSRNQGHGVYGLSRLLPLHIACLYGASAATLNILLQEYPEGSSIEVLGMLPVHMVAANWSLVPTEESSRYDSDANHSVEGFDSKKDRIKALVECSPGSLWVNSSAHGLRPLEYTRILLCYPSYATDEGMIRARNHLDSQEKKCSCRPLKHAQNIVKRPKDECMGPSSIGKDDDVYYIEPIEATSTCTTSGISSAWMANDSSSVYSSSASSSQHTRQILGGLLSQSRWKEAMFVLEKNPEAAKELCFSNNARDFVSGNDGSFSSSSSSGLKEQLPIHMVCQIFKEGFSIPIDLVRRIISSHPEGLEKTDDDSMSGSLPLHLICDSFHHRRKHNHLSIDGSSEDLRFSVSERLQALQLILAAFPDATHFVDNHGRLPLHRAIKVGAPMEAIQLLVYRYPKAIAISDREGMTPFCLAKKEYAFGSPVMELLKRAWI